MAKRLGSKYWQGHLEAWERNGLTQAGYCENHGLSIKTFQRWRSKERAMAKPSTVTLVPVRVSAPTRSGGVQLHSPGGWRIELDGSLTGLAELLRQLP